MHMGNYQKEISKVQFKQIEPVFGLIGLKDQRDGSSFILHKLLLKMILVVHIIVSVLWHHHTS